MEALTRVSTSIRRRPGWVISDTGSTVIHHEGFQENREGGQEAEKHTWTKGR